MLYLSLCTILLAGMFRGQELTGTMTDQIADGIYDNLNAYMESLFDVPYIKKSYNFQTYTTLTGAQILEKLRMNVTKQFLNSEKSLANIRQSALDSYYSYTGDRCDFDFLERFKNRTNKNLPVHYYKTANFKRNVSITNSSLVLPVDVYYNWSEVRETILWTQKMDSTFKTNWSPNLIDLPCYIGYNVTCPVPDNILLPVGQRMSYTGSATMLQYIGTPHGVMRVYPSYYTPRLGKWITYDHRFRIWYAVGAMESNKVVFLMDKSGTLVGEPVKLMREMAINIIKTMISDEDYISVLTFNQKVEPLGCGFKLIRARGRIKTILNEQIRKIRPEGSGNMTEAIRIGFKLLHNSKSQHTCHSTLVLFTDYTQTNVLKLLQKYNRDGSVKVVLLQVGKDIMFSTDLAKVAEQAKGIHARIMDLSDINPTVLKLTGEYTSLVDDDDLQVKATPMYKDASTDEYITTLVLPVVTDKDANWTFKSKLKSGQGSFLGVAAVDIESKSLGQYPLSIMRGCYSITVDTKGSVLYHPVLYRTTESIEIDQKLHLYSYLDNGDTIARVEQTLVFQNDTRPIQATYLEVSDSSMSLRNKAFVNTYYFNILVAVHEKVSMLHICNRKSLSFPNYANVRKSKVSDVIPDYMGPQIDTGRNKAYCSYSTIHNTDYMENETVEEYTQRKLQFPECHDIVFETFDDIYMTAKFLYKNLIENSSISVTAASGNRFEIGRNKKLYRTNNRYTRERYNRLISLITNDNNNINMMSLTNITKPSNKETMYEISRIIYHTASDSYPLMLTAEFNKNQLDKIIEKPFKTTWVLSKDYRYLVDENGFILNSDDGKSNGLHLAKKFPSLMQRLLDKGIYTGHNHTECYFSCEVYYPFNSNRTKSSANSVTKYLKPSYKLLFELGCSIGYFLHSFFYKILFILINPISFVKSMPDKFQKYNMDWKVIKINLTCCHIHPFFSRNFSVIVDKGSIVSHEEDCEKKFRYSAIKNTNMLFVRAFCGDCECNEPVFDLSTVTNMTLNPCHESDDNYNPTLHCTENRRDLMDNGETKIKIIFVIPMLFLVLLCY